MPRPTTRDHDNEGTGERHASRVGLPSYLRPGRSRSRVRRATSKYPSARGTFVRWPSASTFTPPESVASLGETTVWSLAAARTFTQPDDWWRRSIVNVSRMGPFSSERTTRQYPRRSGA